MPSSLPSPSSTHRDLPTLLGEDAIIKLVEGPQPIEQAVNTATRLEQAAIDLYVAGNHVLSNQYYKNAAQIYSTANLLRPLDRYLKQHEGKAHELMCSATKARDGWLFDALEGETLAPPATAAESDAGPSSPSAIPVANHRTASAPLPGTLSLPPAAPQQSDVAAAPARRSVIEDPTRLEAEAAKVKTCLSVNELLTFTLDKYVTVDSRLRVEIDSLLKDGNNAQADLKKEELKAIWGFAQKNPLFKNKRSAESVDAYYKQACDLGSPRHNDRLAAAAHTAGSDDTRALQSLVDACIDNDPKARVKWDDVAGMEHIKEQIESAILDPMILSELYRGTDDLTRGILLYGPPGNGKTFLVKGLKDLLSQQEGTDVTLFVVTGAQMNGKYVGEGEKFMHLLFETAKKHEPSIIFIDEVETVIPKRGDNQSEATHKVQNQFLQETDGFNDAGKVIVIGATNKPHLLDSAANRRLPRRFYIGNPDSTGRARVLEKVLEKYRREGFEQATTHRDIADVALNYMDGFSCSDIAAVVKAAYTEGPVGRLKRAQHWTTHDNKIYPSAVPVAGGQTCRYTEVDKLGLDFECGPITFDDLVQQSDEMTPSTTEDELQWYADYQQKLHANKKTNRQRHLVGSAKAASSSEQAAKQSEGAVLSIHSKGESQAPTVE